MRWGTDWPWEWYCVLFNYVNSTICNSTFLGHIQGAVIIEICPSWSRTFEQLAQYEWFWSIIIVVCVRVCIRLPWPLATKWHADYHYSLLSFLSTMWLVVWGRILSLALVTCVVMKWMGNGKFAMMKGVELKRVEKEGVEKEGVEKEDVVDWRCWKSGRNDEIRDSEQPDYG